MNQEFATYQTLAMRTAAPIPGYEGIYEITEHGVITRMSDAKTGGHKSGKVIKHKKHKNGYSFVCLSKDGVVKDYSIHRLVASTFIKNPEMKPTVNHKDGNKRNNFYGNLEWATFSENITHSFRELGHKGPQGETCGNSKLTTEQVMKIRAERSNGITCSVLSEKYGVSAKQISVVSRGVQWPHI